MVRTSSVIAIANTPSLNVSTRDLFIAANLARPPFVPGLPPLRPRRNLSAFARRFPQVNVGLRTPTMERVMTDSAGQPDPAPAAGRGKLAQVLETRGGRAAPEAPFVIEHREALIYMLCQAAELEHGIMCQYLFAAFSLKQHAEEGLTPEELEAVKRWRRTIAHVGTEEMLHLALVQNVLSAIGAAPHLTRPNLPAP